MKTKIIKIGNSQGIRIPKSILEQTQLKNVVELEIKDDYLIIKSSNKPRQGWDAAFKKMSENQDDKLLDINNPKINSLWDKDHWEW